MQHEAIEAEEEERVREFQGLPVDSEEGSHPEGVPGSSAPQQQQVIGGDAAGGEQKAGRSPEALESEEAARAERAAFAKAQAAKFGKDVKEASKRGEW